MDKDYKSFSDIIKHTKVLSNRKYNSFNDIIIKFNPYHDRLGRFSSRGSAASFTIQVRNPKKQYLADNAIEREKLLSGEGANEKGKEGIVTSKQNQFKNISTSFERKHHVSVDFSLKDADIKAVEPALKAIDSVLTEFPKVQEMRIVKRIAGEELNENIFAQASFDGVITVNTNSNRYGNAGILEKEYQKSVEKGFHPQGTTAKDIAAHETGHLLEKALIEKNVSGFNQLDTLLNRANAWRKSSESRRVIKEATKACKGRISTRVSEVSKYAESNRSEALAECVADYQANGENAKPLSKEVWKILKRELG